MTVDYLSILDAHYECEGTAGLLDSVGSADWAETGAVGEVSGLIGNARGTCDGDWSSGRGFTIDPTSTPFDTRTSQGVSAFTLVAWFKLSGAAGGQEIAASGRSTAGNLRQFLCRVNQDLGGGNQTPSFGLWDHNTDTQFRVLGTSRTAAGAMPTGVWCMYGASVDINFASGDGEIRVFAGIPGEGTFYSTFGPISGWDPLQAPSNDIVGLGAQLNHSADGLDGDLDQVDWYQNTAFVETDFDYFWNSGLGRAYPGAYITPVSFVGDIHHRVHVPANSQQLLIPRKPKGLLANSHPEVFNDALFIETGEVMPVTIISKTRKR